MPMNFPDTPTTGSSFTSAGSTWMWNGTAWKAATVPGVGLYLPLTGGTLSGPGNLTVNGYLGIAITPPSDAATGTVVANYYVSTSVGGTAIFNNAYNSASGTKLLTAAAATALNMNSSGFQFYTAPSGAAGSAPAWVQRAAFDTSGNIILGGSLYVGSNNVWFAGVTSGNGPRAYGDTANMSWQLGTGNSGWQWWNNPGAQAMGLTAGGVLSVYSTADPGQTTTSAGFSRNRWRFAVNSGDEGSAGAIDYRGFDAGAMGIVGAGTAGGNRVVHVWDNLTVDHNLTIGGNAAMISTASGNLSISTPAGGNLGTIGLYGSVLTPGNVYPQSNNATSCGYPGNAWYQVAAYNYPNQSDLREKTGLADLPDCLDLVRVITPQRFRWKEGPPQEQGKTHWGFVAQDVGAAMDAAGHEFGDHVIDQDRHMLNYSGLTAILWKAVQELTEEVAALKGTRT